jgi:hypothetical protein
MEQRDKETLAVPLLKQPLMGDTERVAVAPVAPVEIQLRE